jgi:hypothetical protein
MTIRIRPLPVVADPSDDFAAFVGCVLACMLVFAGLLLAASVSAPDLTTTAHAPAAR